MRQEVLGDPIKSRSARHFQAPYSFDELPFQQVLHDARTIHAADSFNLRARGRLPVGDDGKNLCRGLGKLFGAFVAEQGVDKWAVFFAGTQEKALGYLFKAEGALLRKVFLLQFDDQIAQQTGFEGLEGIDDFADFSKGQGVAAGKQQRFDDSFSVLAYESFLLVCALGLLDIFQDARQ